MQQPNAHRTEEREVLYPWHPWFRRVVWVHKAFEKRASDVFRCGLNSDKSARSLELPAWMFDRMACASMRLATAPQVNCAALLALQACLAAAVSGLCGAVRQNFARFWRRTGLLQPEPGSRSCQKSSALETAGPQPNSSISSDPPPLAAMKGPAWSQLPEKTREAATKLMARLLLDHGPVACGPEGGRDDVR